MNLLAFFKVKINGYKQVIQRLRISRRNKTKPYEQRANWAVKNHYIFVVKKMLSLFWDYQHRSWSKKGVAIDSYNFCYWPLPLDEKSLPSNSNSSSLPLLPSFYPCPPPSLEPPHLLFPSFAHKPRPFFFPTLIIPF